MTGIVAVTMRAKTTFDSYFDDFNPGSQQIVQNAIGSQAGVITVSTGTTTIPTNQLSVVGVFEFTNTDANNYVTIGPSTTTGSTPYPMIKVKPGESHLTRLSTGVIIRATADTAAVKLQYNILED